MNIAQAPQRRSLEPLAPVLHSSAYLERVRRAVTLSRSFGFAVILSIQDQGLGGFAFGAATGP